MICAKRYCQIAHSTSIVSWFNSKHDTLHMKRLLTLAASCTLFIGLYSCEQTELIQPNQQAVTSTATESSTTPVPEVPLNAQQVRSSAGGPILNGDDVGNDNIDVPGDIVRGVRNSAGGPIIDGSDVITGNESATGDLDRGVRNTAGGAENINYRQGNADRGVFTTVSSGINDARQGETATRSTAAGNNAINYNQGNNNDTRYQVGGSAVVRPRQDDELNQ